MPPNDRLAAENIGMERDALEKLVHFHDGNMPCILESGKVG
jgi:hypothetical protein